LFLVKDDPSISRDQETVIFYGSAEERKKQQRDAKQRRWRYHHDNITAAKSYPMGDHLRPLPELKELFLRGSFGDGGPDVGSSDMFDEDAATTTGTAADIDDDIDADNDVLQIELV